MCGITMEENYSTLWSLYKILCVELLWKKTIPQCGKIVEISGFHNNSTIFTDIDFFQWYFVRTK